MKKSKLTAVLVSVLVFSILASAFITSALGSDENTGVTPFDALVDLGLAESIPKNANIARIDALKSLLCVIGEIENAEKYEGNIDFCDINGDSAPYVSYASELGIIIGDGNGFFYPDKAITLEEMLIMSLRTLGYTDIDEDNVYSLAENAQLYTYTHDDSLYFYLNGGRMAEILWNLLSAEISGSESTYAQLLMEIGMIDSERYGEALASVSYVFGDTTNARTYALTEETESQPETTNPETTKPETTKPETTTKPSNTENNDGWSPIWRPGQK